MIDSQTLQLNFLVLHAPSAAPTKVGGPQTKVYRQLCSSNNNNAAAASAAASEAAAAANDAATAAPTAEETAAPAAEETAAATAAERVRTRGVSFVQFHFDVSAAAPPPLQIGQSAASALQQVWGGPPSSGGPPSYGGPPCSVGPPFSGGPPGEGGPHEEECEGEEEDRKRVLLEELQQTGFVNQQQQQLLLGAPIARWGPLMPSVAARYCKRKFAINYKGEEGADDVLYIHQNG